LDPLPPFEGPFLDPLGHSEPLPLAERFFPLGFPLVLRTNSEDVLVAAREGWCEYEPAFQTPPIELRVIVRGDESTAPHASPQGPAFCGQGHLLALVMGPDNVAVCDLDRCFGFARLTPAVARNHLFASFHFLDSMAYVSISQRYATPVHGSCVARNGDGILLVGGAGAGKSSLAWACSRAGLAYVCDDGVWVLRDAPELTLLGKCQRIRFRPEALDLFPELRELPRREAVLGKHSFEVRTADVPGLVTARRCRLGKLIFLERQPSGPAQFEPVEPEEARRRLSAVGPLYDFHTWQQHEVSRAQLARNGGLALRYSRLSDGVERILSLL
jgi:hypothetical protein